MVDNSSEHVGQRHARVRNMSMAVLTATIWLASVAGRAPSGSSATRTILIAFGAAAVQLAFSQRAHTSQFSGTRAFQASQLWVGALAGGIGALVLSRLLLTTSSLVGIVLGACGAALVQALIQESEAARGARSQKRQRAVIIGTGEEASEWVALMSDHPEMGIDIVGCIGDSDQANRVGLADHWLGPIADLEQLLTSERVDLPIVAVTSFRRPALQSLVKRLLVDERDVAMSWGVGRLSTGRLTSRTFSHETLPVIRAHRPSGSSLRIKRVFDVVLSATMLVVASPILLLAAIVIQIDSKGPALFRQKRVGLNSEPFEMIKLRTMKRDAEDELHQLAGSNERSGPLFKIASDPRVTTVGKFLRASSIDEIPQLWNVLRGQMSLVGPRPALLSESESFDEELTARASVRPGITGLWQLEARANKSFHAYKRLDLHYLENWSLGLDLRIAVATAQLLVMGAVVAPFTRRLTKTGVSPELTPGVAAVDTPDTSAARREHIGVLGAGYVGLTQALGLTNLGHHVVCADLNPTRIAELQAGIPPILEDGLEQLLADSNASGRLTFTSDPLEAVDGADYVFLCVATPQREDGAADLRYLEAAARQIGPVLKPGAVVINKSTVPVGSTDLVAGEMSRDDVHVVSNPEFLREGTAIADWNAPDRIVVGGEEDAAQRVMGLYEALPGRRIVCDAPSAELIKYASNAYLATRLTFVNSLSEVCDSLGADIMQVTTAMGLDARIGPRYLSPGPGWGGSCLPKDTHALAYQSEQVGADFDQLRATIAANESHLDRAARMIVQALPGDPKVATVAALGMAFKAGTGDTRESPAIKIIERLIDSGVTVKAYDPGVVTPPIDAIHASNSGIDCARDADALVVLTEWPEFLDLDFAKITEVMTTKVVVDLRNHLDPKELYPHGFEYHSLGSRPLSPQAR